MNKEQVHLIAKTVQKWRAGFKDGCKVQVLYFAGARIAQLPKPNRVMTSLELEEFCRCLRVMGWKPKYDQETAGPAKWYPPRPKRKKRPRMTKK